MGFASNALGPTRTPSATIKPTTPAEQVALGAAQMGAFAPIFSTALKGWLYWDPVSGSFQPAVAGTSLLNPREVYVDKGAPAGGNGSVLAPFKTGALGTAALAAGGTLHIAGATTPYAETLNIPPALDDLTISAEGPDAVVFSPTTGHGISHVPTATITALRLVGVSGLSQDNSDGLHIDASATPNAYMSSMDGLRIETCNFDSSGGGNAVSIKRANYVWIDNDVQGFGNFAPWLITNTARVTMWGTFISGPVTQDFNAINPVPTTAQAGVYLRAGSWSIFSYTIAHQAQLHCDGSAKLASLASSALTIDGGGNGPVVDCDGTTFSGAIDLATSPIPSGCPAGSFTLNQCTIGGTFAVDKAAAGRYYVDCRGSVFQSTVSAGPGSLVDLDVRGGSYPSQASLLAPGGSTIDRDRHIFPGATVKAAGQAQTFVPPFPTSVTAASLAVAITPTALATGVCFVTGKSNTGFTSTSTMDGTADITVVRG